MNEAPQNTHQEGASPSGAQALGPGVVLGGVYRIEEKLGDGGLGALYRAVDVRSDTDVALRVLRPELASSPEVVAGLGRQAELSAALDHKNIARTYGMAVEGSTVFLVTEHVSGQSLRDIIDKKREAGKPFSLKGAYNIVAHLCNACGYAHEFTFHGALHPGNVFVNPAGRIKVTEYGIGRTASGLGNVESLLGGQGFLYLAPEMAQTPRAADERADVYAVGVILNELLTGRAPVETFESPSSVRPGLPVEVDQVIGRCMRPVPDERFETIQELKLALMGALEGAAEVPLAGSIDANAASGGAESPDIDIDIDIDEPEAAVVPKPAPAAPARPAATPVPAAPLPAVPALAAPSPVAPPVGAPAVGLVPAAQDDPFGAPAASPGGSGLPGLPSLGGDAFDLGSLISGATGEEDEKYLISKKGLDFGPFGLMEVKRQIAAGDIRPQDMVVEVDTGKRTKVKAHPLLKDFTLEIIRRQEAQRRAQAESATETIERRKKRVLVLGVLVAVGVIGLGVGSIFIYQGIAKKGKGLSARGDEEASYRGSDEDPEGMGGMGGMGGGMRRYRGGGGPTGLDMQLDVTDKFDFAAGGGEGGGSERLDPSVIRSVIDQRKNGVGNCMLSAGARSITVSVQVKGNGSLAYVNTSPKSAASCVRRALAGLRFPKFNGTVTQGSYHLSM